MVGCSAEFGPRRQFFAQTSLLTVDLVHAYSNTDLRSLQAVHQVSTSCAWLDYKPRGPVFVSTSYRRICCKRGTSIVSW